MPTVEMIRVKLVSARMANRMLTSHLCQRKDSEVLNSFHPESGGGGGGGAQSAIRKNVEEEPVCRFLSLLVLRVEGSRDAVVKEASEADRGASSRNSILRIKESRGVEVEGYEECTALLYMWSDPSTVI